MVMRNKFLIVLMSTYLAAGLLSSSLADNVGFFPDRVFSDRPDTHGLYASWFTKFLRAMNEPSLSLDHGMARHVAVYRLLWLPNNDKAKCFRFDNKDGVAAMRFVELTGFGGYSPGATAVDKTVPVRSDQWGRIAGVIDDMEFWKLPSYTNLAVLDGDVWILEARIGDRYHVVKRVYVSQMIKPVPENGYVLRLYQYCMKLAEGE